MHQAFGASCQPQGFVFREGRSDATRELAETHCGNLVRERSALDIAG
jgi:hypothetical protein